MDPLECHRECDRQVGADLKSGTGINEPAEFSDIGPEFAKPFQGPSAVMPGWVSSQFRGFGGAEQYMHEKFPPGYGPGTELKAILESLGIEAGPMCDVRTRANQMDLWGVEGCNANREQFLSRPSGLDHRASI